MVQFKKWQLVLVILFSFFAIIFSLPNFLSKEILKKLPFGSEDTAKYSKFFTQGQMKVFFKNFFFSKTYFS